MMAAKYMPIPTFFCCTIDDLIMGLFNFCIGHHAEAGSSDSAFNWILAPFAVEENQSFATFVSVRWLDDAVEGVNWDGDLDGDVALIDKHAL